MKLGSTLPVGQERAVTFKGVRDVGNAHFRRISDNQVSVILVVVGFDKRAIQALCGRSKAFAKALPDALRDNCVAVFYHEHEVNE